ncbi:LOW QUALITY PROTEIN: hypothetical protein V2J09_000922 [Rumex salicifolius]
MERVLDQEELLWKQILRDLWLCGGDRNTSFSTPLPLFAAGRIGSKRSKMIKGTACPDVTLITNFYTNLYFLFGEELYPNSLPYGHFPVVEASCWNALVLPFDEMEISQAVRMMGALKAPGADGFQPIFIENESMVRAVQEFFQSSSIPKGLNETLITIIPKNATLLKDLIRPTQGRFILGWVITDNVVLAQEVVHSIRFKKGVKGGCFSKATSKKLTTGSSGISCEVKANLQVESGFPVVEDLGSYIGITLIHKRVKKEVFRPLLDKINKKLSGGGGGEVTLTKSVISSIPVYTMGSLMLPINGGTTERRRMHLVNWEQVTKDKALRGLGVKCMVQWNMDLLGKLSWHFLTQSSSLWATVIRTKYIRPSNTSQRNPFYIWRDIQAGNLVVKGCCSNLGNGAVICFWKDVWVLDKPLHNKRLEEIDEDFREAVIRDVWQCGIGWN